MPYNIDKDTIEAELRAICECYKRDDSGFAELAEIALLNVLQKELSQQDEPKNLKKIKANELDETTPMWLTSAFNEGKDVYKFHPDAYLRDDIFYILGWIETAIKDKAEWLSDVDERGRPKKLVKLGTLQQARAEADKALEISAQKIASAPPEDTVHEHTVMTFDDGFRIVKMRTPQALQYESEHMRHCVGNDLHGHLDKVQDGCHDYFSLRDPNNRGHVTMQVYSRQNLLKECKGKQNAIPIAKYMPYIQAFVKEQNFSLSVKASQTGLIDQGGGYYDINNLPENFYYEGNLNLSEARIKTLPRGLHVNGDLYLQNSSLEALPEDLVVTGSLVISKTNVTALPESIKIGKNLIINDTDISVLPEGLSVNKDLVMHGTPIEALPQTLLVRGDLDARRSQLKAIPAGVRIGGGVNLRETLVTSLPDNFEVFGDLNLGETPIAILPKGLKVHNTLHLFNTNVAALPADLDVGMHLYLQRAPIKSIPASVKIGGNLELSYSEIQSLPDNFRVHGNLKLNETAIKVLPDGLYVEGDLDLHESKIAMLPNGLYVGGELDILGSNIESFPDDLVVNGVVSFNVILGSVDLDEARKYIRGNNANDNSSPTVSRPLSPGM